MGKTFEQKLYYSSIAALIFALVSMPNVYKYTNSVFDGLTKDNCPTPLGKVVHGLVFLALNFAVMKWMNSRKPHHMQKPDGLLFKYAIYGTLVYYLLSDNDTYILTSQAVGNVSGLRLANAVGCPSGAGVAVHSVVYALSLVGLMSLPKDSVY